MSNFNFSGNSQTTNCSKMTVEGEDTEQMQLTHWLDSQTREILYREPILNENAINIIKEICDILHQNQDTFTTTVDILEEYIHLKDMNRQPITSCLLTASCCILLANKLIGTSIEIKINDLQSIVMKKTNTEISREEVKAVELDVIVTLGKLPVTTTVTNLIMLLQYYVTNVNIQQHLEPICQIILSIFYIMKYELFFQVKSIYDVTSNGKRIFRKFICNKLYFPAIVLLCGIQMTVLTHSLNLNQMVEDLANIINVDYEHVHLSYTIFYDKLRTVYNNDNI